jgi:hypothetical protein
VRFLPVAAAVCLSLLPVAGELAPAQEAAPAQAAAADGAAASGAAASPSGEAAAKHAKRTACLKNAKEKKLVGADKASFLKACIAAP